MRRSSLLAIPVSVVLAATLAACGGASEEPPSAPSTTAAAAEAEATVAPAADELTAENLFARLAAAQAAAQSYDMAMSITGATSMDLTGSADLTGGKQNIAASINDPASGTFELRLVDGIMYINLGELSGGLFLQIDPNDASNPLASSFAGFGDDMLKSGYEGMEGAVTTLIKTGNAETINGVEAQEYTAVLDTAKLAPEATAGLLGDDPAAALPATLTYTFWIDDRDLPVRTVFEVAGTTTTTDVSNIGSGTPVVAPPADQVTTEMPF